MSRWFVKYLPAAWHIRIGCWRAKGCYKTEMAGPFNRHSGGRQFNKQTRYCILLKGFS